MKDQEQMIIKALVWFAIYLGAEIWLFTLDWKIALCVTLITLSIYNDNKMQLKIHKMETELTTNQA